MPGVIVHEWIEKIGGSEKVLDEIAAAFPGLDIVCLWNNAPDRFPGHRVHESVLARTPLRGKKALALPAMPFVWSALPNHDYDWAIVSTHAFAHQAHFRGQRDDFRKYVYAHTPARYIWTPELDVRGGSGLIRAVSPAFKRIDRKRAQSATAIAANSAFVRERIRMAWERDAEVIYPPVDVVKIQEVGDWREKLTPEELHLLDSLPESFLFSASRFIPYKRLDAVIRAGEASGHPVVIGGSGPEEERLRAQAAAATVPVTIVNRPSDAMLYALYQRALAFVFPPIEDFGIMPVEAMAVGSPVVSSAIGGTTETVLDGVTGAHVHDWDSPSDVAAAIERAIVVDRTATAEHARTFDRSVFTEHIRNWVEV